MIRDLTQRWHCVYIRSGGNFSSVRAPFECFIKIYKNDNSFKREVILLKTAERRVEYLINQTRESWKGGDKKLALKDSKTGACPVRPYFPSWW